MVLFQEVGGFSGGRAIVDDGHERLGHAGGVLMLDHIAAVDDAGHALFDELFRALEDFLVGSLSAATDEHRDASGDFHHFVIDAHVIGRVGLDDVRAELDGLAHQREDLLRIAIDHVTTGLGVGLEHERLDHQRHAVAIAVGFDLENVLDALIRHLGLAGDAEEIHHDAGRVEAQGLLDRVFNHAAEESAGQLLAIDIGHVGAEHERGLLPAGDRLQKRGLAHGELDRVGGGFDQRGHGLVEAFDAGEEAVFVEKAVIDGDVETAVGLGVEETIETVCFHDKN